MPVKKNTKKIIQDLKTIPLWENGPPGFEERRQEPEIAQDYWVKNIHDPSLTVFRPAKNKANGCAVIVAPGGGLKELVFKAEGLQSGEFLVQFGITVFVLKYRLPKEKNSPYRIQNLEQDALRAIRLVRSAAKEYSLDSTKIGILGFSAGAEIIKRTVFNKNKIDDSISDPVDRLNCRPDFQILIYPGIRVPFLIPPGTPPAFLLAANDDEYGCDKTALKLFHAYRRAGVPSELHLLSQGKHAFNMGDRSEFSSVKNWPWRMAEWLADSGFIRQKDLGK